MKFNKHSDLEGKHAFLSPSKYHWINYDQDRLNESFGTYLAKVRGTELHDLACKAVRMGIRLQDSNDTVNMYVNDGIDFGMTTEQPLYFSENCFGTCDAISFDGYVLRIHDLKTGYTRTSFHQLEIYAAIFCLEYKIDPHDIDLISLKIYQLNEVRESNPEPDYIYALMNKIILFDQQIERAKSDE